MDYKKLIPDFGAIAKTNWAKPNLDTKNPMWLVMAGVALLMVIFTFISWENIVDDVTYTRSGITTWFGILGFISTLIAVYGILYKQYAYVFCAAILAAVFGIIGCVMVVDASITIFGITNTYTVAELNSAKAFAADAAKYGVTSNVPEVSHTGAILFLVASLALAAVSFLQIKKENE